LWSWRAIYDRADGNGGALFDPDSQKIGDEYTDWRGWPGSWGDSASSPLGPDFRDRNGPTPVSGQRAHRPAEASGRSRIVLAVLALILIALAVQSLVAFRFFLYCDENLRPGTDREMVCQVADDGGYVAGIVLPPATVLIAGLVGIKRRRIAIAYWGFGVVMIVGIGVPLTAALLAGYR
jgi:hypothetical protein